MSANKSYRKFTITIISAKNLRNVRKVFNNQVHARVMIGGNSETERRTRKDKRNGLNPAWNQVFEYDILESGVKQHGLPLVIKMYSSRAMGDKYIGQVHTSIKELFDYAMRYGEAGSAILELEVNRGGVLKFSYKFGEVTMDGQSAFWVRILKAGATMLLRERVGKMVINLFRGPRNRWGWRSRAKPPQQEIGPWFGPVRLIKCGGA